METLLLTLMADFFHVQGCSRLLVPGSADMGMPVRLHGKLSLPSFDLSKIHPLLYFLYSVLSFFIFSFFDVSFHYFLYL
jgi:hypothetical protein